MDNAHILIVDDNPEIREIIQILLSGEGFLTEEAKTEKPHSTSYRQLVSTSSF